MIVKNGMKKKLDKNFTVTTLKTVRVSKKLVEKLDSILYKQNKNFNQLINEFIEEYVNYRNKLEQITREKPIIISSRFFKHLIDLLGEDLEKIKEKSYKLGKEWGKEYLLLWNNSNVSSTTLNDINIFIKYLKDIAEYSGLYKLDIIEKKGSLTVIFHHDYSNIFSALLAFYYKGIFEAFYDNYEISDIAINQNNFIISITMKNLDHL